MRTIILRSIQALVSISAVVLLTGANDAGCGFTETGGNTGTGTGTGVAGGDGGTGVECPDGTIAQWTCGHGSDCGNTPPPVCDCPLPPDCPPGANCPIPDIACVCDEPPPPEDCVLECVPVTNICPAGFHNEVVCDPAEPPPPPMDPNDPSTPFPGAMGGSEPSYPGGSCSEVCVPDNACPPGTVQQTVCSGGGMIPTDPADPATPPPPPQEDACWNECVPVNPACPPGSHEEVACPPDGMGAPCQLTCVPDGGECPAGQHAEQQCYDDGMGQGTCTFGCVDDVPPGN